MSETQGKGELTVAESRRVEVTAAGIKISNSGPPEAPHRLQAHGQAIDCDDTTLEAVVAYADALYGRKPKRARRKRNAKKEAAAA